jgi:hypothetical protein
MVDKAYDRRCKLIIASENASTASTVTADVIEISSSLRVQFNISKSLTRHPNTAKIVVNNLAESTRSKIQDKGARIVLMAGYEGSLSQIFIGNVRLADHKRDKTEWVTEIECGDGEGAVSSARVSESFAPGIKMPEIVTKLTSVLGVDSSDVAKKIQGAAHKQFVHGYVSHGPATKELDRILKGAGYEWSIQDSKLQVLKPGEANTERVVVLSPSTGLIGDPSYGTGSDKKKPHTIKFKALLNGLIKPGGRVELNSERHKGLHRVLSVKHDGDTRGGNWYTEGECEVIKPPSTNTVPAGITKQFVTDVGALASHLGKKNLTMTKIAKALGRPLTSAEQTWVRKEFSGIPE